MKLASIRREEEAVSAAVATVLLFGGIISIIAMMMVTMLPVIQELEGSVERNGMVTQMNEYAIETVRLSETGMPGDSIRMEIDPLRGDLRWDNQRGGIWVSSTWAEGHSLRIRNVLDLDNVAEFRHLGGEVESVCWEDMRLGPERLFNYRIPVLNGTLLVTPSFGLAQDTAPVELTLHQGEGVAEGSITGFGIWSVDLPLESGSGEGWLTSSSQVSVALLRGEGGASVISPSSSTTSGGEGRAWSLPLPTGQSTIHLISSETSRVEWEGAAGSGEEIVPAAGGFFESGSAWSKTFTTSSPSNMRITSSSDARLLMVSGSGAAGDAPWPSNHGSAHGKEFLLPNLSGDLLIDNPSDHSVVVRYLGGALAVSANDSIRVDWPPIGSEGAVKMSADDPVKIHWLADGDGIGADRGGSLHIETAIDTGGLSGHQISFTTPTVSGSTAQTSYSLQVAGVSAAWNLTTWNITGVSSHSDTSTILTPNGTGITDFSADTEYDSLRILVSAGDSGMSEIPHDGSHRCRVVGIQASGWISSKLPWHSVASAGPAAVEIAWRDGTHPSSIILTVNTVVDGVPHITSATAWAFHMPRLTYVFDSSISGLEVATRGGAVMTNHPEVQAKVLRGPSDRAGPGPRFAATIPLAFPVGDTLSGGGAQEIDLTMMQRYQLTSASALEVRRGWEGPYGTAIAGFVAQDLSHSEDWTTFPQRLDLLDDYKGWVPDPTPDSSETVYHTQSEPIQFTLQVSVLHHQASEVGA